MRISPPQLGGGGQGPPQSSPAGAAAGGCGKLGAPRGSPAAPGCGRRWLAAEPPISLGKKIRKWSAPPQKKNQRGGPPKIHTRGLSPSFTLVPWQFLHEEKEEAAGVVFGAVEEGLVPHVAPKSQLLRVRNRRRGHPKSFGVSPSRFGGIFLGGEGSKVWNPSPVNLTPRGERRGDQGWCPRPPQNFGVPSRFSGGTIPGKRPPSRKRVGSERRCRGAGGG